MKILQILPELKIGGVERGTVDLARELVNRGHDAIVVSNGGRLVKELESSGAKHIKLAVHKKSLFSILANVFRLVDILQKEKVDIVHARSRVPALIAFLACRRTGTKFITTCHGYYSQNFASRVMGWGRCVIVSSNAIAKHMIEDFGVPEERIRLIPRGVDLQKFKFLQKPEPISSRPDIFTVGVIGRLSPIKGHKCFLQAIAGVIRVLPKIHAIIAGEASANKIKYKEELKMLTRRLSLDRYVEFIAYQDDVPKLLERLDVLVLPTVTQEAFGRVLIEAGACGVPVIATRVGGVVDIIQDGENGFLVEPGDPDGLASAIIKLFKDPGLARKFALAGRKRVEQNFSLKRMAERTITVYEEVKDSLKILVIKLSALGDVILIGPSLRALRKNFSTAHITILVGQPYRSIIQNCPYIDEIIEFSLERKDYKEIWRTSSLLRRLDFDIVVDLQNNRRSHLLAYLSASSRRYGYNNGKFSFLLNRKVKETKLPLSPIRHQARTLELLDIESVEENLELWPREKDWSWAENFLKKYKKGKTAPLIGINIGASVAWPSKRWEIEKLAILINKLYETGMEVVITGKGEDKRLTQSLSRLSKSHFIDAVDKTRVLELACLIRHCNVYITTDSAPMHIAYAMKTPVVALFGPTDPGRHTILSTRQIIIKKDISCSPCYKRRCRKHSCMQEISPEEVFEAVKQLLGDSFRFGNRTVLQLK